MTDTAVETPVAEATEEAKPVKAPKVATACACQLYTGTDKDGNALATGCDGETVRTFLPGHDAKTKSLILKVAIAGGQVTKTVDGESEELEPLHAAEDFGFRGLIEKSLASAQAKQAVRDAKAGERAEKKAATEKKKAEAKAKREQANEAKKAHAKAVEEAAEARKGQPGPATAKIGRAKFDGVILEDGTFKYTNAKGEEVETGEYSVVIDPATVPVPTAS